VWSHEDDAQTKQMGKQRERQKGTERDRTQSGMSKSTEHDEKQSAWAGMSA